MMKSTLVFVAMALFTACTSNPHAVSVPIDGTSLYFDDGGVGDPAVLFLHGMGGSSEQWREQLQHLRTHGHRAVAMDLPGFGRSTAPATGDYSLEAMVDAIDKTAAAIHLERFIIVGHSYGGAVAATYAAAHPDRVAGVIYVDSAPMKLPLNDEQKNQLAAALRADKMKVVRTWFTPMLKPSSQAVSDKVFASVERTSTDAIVGAFLSLADYEAEQTVNAFSGPRLAIGASEIETPASFHKRFPQIESVRISGAGHWLMLDKPDEVNAAIDMFLSSKTARTR